MFKILCLFSTLYSVTSLNINIDAGPNSLLNAQKLVQQEISKRQHLLASSANEVHFDDIEVILAPGKHYSPLDFTLTEEDSGLEGLFNVIWKGSSGSGVDNNTVIDGGITIPGWQVVDATTGLYKALAPAEVKAQPYSIRHLYVDGFKYNRTKDNPHSFNIFGNEYSIRTPDGWIVTSDAPTQWTDPTSVEFIADESWVSLY